MALTQFSLEGKVALITGASRGIGKETAIRFAEAGADVVVTSRKLPDLEKVADVIRSMGRKSLAVATHVGKMDQIQPLVDSALEAFGTIDVLVNNAGTNFFMPAIDMTEKGWDSVMNLNIKGLFFLSQAVARVMKDNGGGRIVNIASASGLKAQPATGHYSIAKAGVIMATKVMAMEWADFNIRANCIAPGAIQTRLYDAIFTPFGEAEGEKAKAAFSATIPLKRAGEPAEIADAALFLASQASSYVTGQTFAVDGGLLLK
jgi:NAD(P)-dependent dehydrogenase (short-subunit alcohol dehydrogenase family)